MNRKLIAGMMALTMGLVSIGQAEPGGKGPEGRGPGKGMGMEGKHMMGPGNPGMAGGQMVRQLLKNPEKAAEFGITPEQAKTLKASFAEMEKKMVGLRAEAETAEIELRELMDQDVPDEAKVMAAIDKVGQARTAIQKANAQQRLLVAKTVSPETRQKLEERIEQRMRMAKGEGDRPERGGNDAPWKKGPMEGPGEE